MTEAEWLACTDREALFRAVRARSKRRRCRLLAVACCRAIVPTLPDPRSLKAIEIAELHADGLADDAELNSAYIAAHEVVAERSANPAVIEAARAAVSGMAGKVAGMQQWAYRMGMERAAECVALPHPYNAADHVGSVVRSTLTNFSGPCPLTQANLIRDIFGSVFRPVVLSPDWRTDTALALARTMYESREFGAMPILADALQDAGCDNDDILNHCRDASATHVRGCWVVDLVLGKE